jgi:hypothetical protein
MCLYARFTTNKPNLKSFSPSLIWPRQPPVSHPLSCRSSGSLALNVSKEVTRQGPVVRTRSQTHTDPEKSNVQQAMQGSIGGELDIDFPRLL